MLSLKLVAVLLFVIWLTLIVLGKGGFVHILLLNSMGVAFVDMMIMYRARLKR